MREQIWLDWFCRRASQTVEKCSNKLRRASEENDPRSAFAAYIDQGIAVINRNAFPGHSPIEDLWYSGLRPFTAPYRDRTAVAGTLSSVEEPSLGLLLTRGSANLLGNARAPAGSDRYWRSILADNLSVYIDVPSGAVVFGGDEKLRSMQLRVLIVPPAPERTQAPGRPFVALLTLRGSESPVGRICGLLEPDGRTSVYPQGTFGADLNLEATSPTWPLVKLARERAGDFLRLVLAYYLFGPAGTSDTIVATSAEHLRNGKPRHNQSLFAITRLRPSDDRLGRPTTSIPQGWSLTVKQKVVGHFKLQAYGSGSSLRRLIWVEPYERGLEGGAIRPKAVSL